MYIIAKNGNIDVNLNLKNKQSRISSPRVHQTNYSRLSCAWLNLERCNSKLYWENQFYYRRKFSIETQNRAVQEIIKTCRF